jgi:hypothetical protein
MYTYKRVVLSSHADVARDANDVDTCLTKPSTAMRARARAASQFHAPPRAFDVAAARHSPDSARVRNARITSGTVFGVCVNNHLGTPRPGSVISV